MSIETPNDPAQPAWGSAAPDVLAARPDESGRRTPWPLVGGVAVLVLALLGGVTYAVGALSGGGQQPADVLPAGALAVVSVDLDPAATQKLDAFRFLRKFPTLRKRVPLDGDLREVLFDAVADEVGWSDVDFDAEVSPWLGKRVAFAAYPGDDAAGPDAEPTVVVALQVTDQAAADTGLRRLATVARVGAADAPVGWSFAGDYALLAEDAEAADAVAARAAERPLAEDEHYAADVAALDSGVALAWFDLARAGEAMGGLGLVPGVAGAGLGTGRTTLVARFDGPDVFELVGRASDVEDAGWAEHGVRGMAELPETTAAAAGLADGELLAPTMWEGLGPFLGGGESLRSELGLSLPDDLATLLGDNLLLAVDSASGGQVDVGARITTDVDEAQRLLDRLAAASGPAGRQLGALGLVRRQVGGDLVLATSDAQADRMAAGGSLGEVDGFRRALPDLDDADAALWVAPAAVWGIFGLGEVDPDLEPIDGIGVTVSGDAADAAAFRVRLVAH